MIHRPFVLASAAGEPIRGDLRHPETDRPLPVIVVCHGFKGFKDWGFHPYLGTRLAGAGFAALHFSFSRCGVGEDLLELSEPEKFRRNTPSVELSDLATVLSAIPAAFPGAPLDSSRIGLVGHSRGGGVAIVGASGDPRVKALVTWAAVATFDRFRDPETVALWRRQGFLEVRNARTGQVLPMGVELLDDLERNRERLDIAAAASRLGCPFSIVHGSADESVPFAEAEMLFSCARRGGEVELVRVEGAGHTFGAVHPFAGTTGDLEAAVAATLRCLDRLHDPSSRERR